MHPRIIRQVLAVSCFSIIIVRVPLPAAPTVEVASLPASPSPLVHLGSLLNPTLASLALPASNPEIANIGLPSIPGVPTPPWFATVKAQILLERALALDTPAPNNFSPKENGRGPVSAGLLVAVNSILKDISPENLSKMSAEDLHGISRLILGEFTHPAAADQAQEVAALALISQARAQRILDDKRVPLRGPRFKENGFFRKLSKIAIEGTPRSVRAVPAVMEETATGWRNMVFRHYTNDEATLSNILLSNALRTGWTPYIEVKPGFFRDTARIFRGLTGVFLTLPQVSPGKIGVPRVQTYVDLLIPAALPLLEIIPDMIYLVPLPHSMPWEKWCWFLKSNVLYQRDPGEFKPYFPYLDGDGMPGVRRLALPIKIQRHSGDLKSASFSQH